MLRSSGASCRETLNQSDDSSTGYDGRARSGGTRGMTSLWFEHALLEQGWSERVRLILEAGRIARIETGVEAQPQDDRHAIAVPGLANLHSHAFQRAMAGLAEAAGPGTDNFWTWREAMYRFADTIGPDELEAITAFAFMEMLESGFTRVGEFHYVHHDPDGRPYSNPAELAERVAAAAAVTGIALTLLPVMYAHSNFGGLQPTQGQRRFINSVDAFERIVGASRRIAASLDDAVVGVAPHSLRAVVPEELAAVIELAPGGPIHIHAAEQTREVDDCVDWSKQRPVEWLLDHASVDERWCLVHATHMSDAETRALAASGAVAGLCPVTESNLGDGVFPTATYLASGGRFGVGTDSNILISPCEELRALEYIQRLTRRARNVLASSESRSTGRRLFDAALAGGAQALGTTTQSLAVGASADIVSLDANHPSLAARSGDELLDSWIFAARGGVVDCVWRFGRKVVAGGRHAQCGRITGRYREVVDTILRR
jgi:formimidoylglutamate deiminase